MTFAPPPPAPPPSVGQRLACTSRHPERRLEAIVGDIAKSSSGVRIISISLRDAARASTLPEVGHMPFGEAAFRASCSTLLQTDAPIPPHFAEGLQEWRKATGGESFFTLSVDQALDAAVGIVADAENSR